MKRAKKKRKPPVHLTEEQEKEFAKEVFAGAIVKQAAFKHGICEKQAYRVIHKYFEWRLEWKNKEIADA